MIRVQDVAFYLYNKVPITHLKMHRILYYAQAWSLVWDKQPLFGDEIQAWPGGPMIPTLYETLKGQFMVDVWPAGDWTPLTEEQLDTVDSVLDFYFKYSAQQLSELSRREDPWMDARHGFRHGDPCNVVISHESMQKYYSSLLISPA